MTRFRSWAHRRRLCAGIMFVARRACGGIQFAGKDARLTGQWQGWASGLAGRP